MKITFELNTTNAADLDALNMLLAYVPRPDSVSAAEDRPKASVSNGHAAEPSIAATQMTQEEFAAVVDAACAAMGDESVGEDMVDLEPYSVSPSMTPQPAATATVEADAPPKKRGRPAKDPNAPPGRRGPKPKAVKEAEAAAAALANGAGSETVVVEQPTAEAPPLPRAPDLSRFGPGPGEEVTPQAPAMPKVTSAAAPTAVAMNAALNAAPPATNGVSYNGISLDDIRNCVTELTQVKSREIAQKWILSNTWPDGTPKTRWFRVESVPPEAYTNLLEAMTAEF